MRDFKVAASDLTALAAKGEEMPVYLWKMNGQIFTFNHSPFEGHKKGEKFSCFLKVTEQDFQTNAFRSISAYSEDKEGLFDDLSKPETVPSKPETVISYPLALVISTVLFAGLVLVFVAYKRTGKT